MRFQGRLWPSPRQAELVFAVFKTLTFVGAVVALFVTPVKPEHRMHLPVLLAFLLFYHLVFCGVIYHWRRRRRGVLLAILACDLICISFLVWFTGGLDSHFYLLFYIIITMNAYFFGFPIGLGSAAVSGLLYTVAIFADSRQAVRLEDLAARIVIFGLLGMSIGFLSERDRWSRVALEELNQQLQQAYRQLQEAHERAIQAERLATMGMVAATVAHDIRTPLGTIGLSLELLEDEMRTGERLNLSEAVKLITTIKAELDRLEAVVEAYLSFARLPSPQFQIEQPNEIIEELAGFYREEAVRRGIELRLELAPDLPTMRVDRHLLRQALMNLVRNACEAMPTGGLLRLATRRAEAGVEMMVEDTGGGVRPEDLPKIFDLFFTTKDQGIGLGLAITRRIVEEHGGSITCTSTLGRGTRFTVQLPIPRDGGLS